MFRMWSLLRPRGASVMRRWGVRWSLSGGLPMAGSRVHPALWSAVSAIASCPSGADASLPDATASVRQRVLDEMAAWPPTARTDVDAALHQVFFGGRAPQSASSQKLTIPQLSPKLSDDIMGMFEDFSLRDYLLTFPDRYGLGYGHPGHLGRSTKSAASSSCSSSSSSVVLVFAFSFPDVVASVMASAPWTHEERVALTPAPGKDATAVANCGGVAVGANAALLWLAAPSAFIRDTPTSEGVTMRIAVDATAWRTTSASSSAIPWVTAVDVESREAALLDRCVLLQSHWDAFQSQLASTLNRSGDRTLQEYLRTLLELQDAHYVDVFVLRRKFVRGSTTKGGAPEFQEEGEEEIVWAGPLSEGERSTLEAYVAGGTAPDATEVAVMSLLSKLVYRRCSPMRRTVDRQKQVAPSGVPEDVVLLRPTRRQPFVSRGIIPDAPELPLAPLPAASTPTPPPDPTPIKAKPLPAPPVTTASNKAPKVAAPVATPKKRDLMPRELPLTTSMDLLMKLTPTKLVALPHYVTSMDRLLRAMVWVYGLLGLSERSATDVMEPPVGMSLQETTVLRRLRWQIMDRAVLHPDDLEAIGQHIQQAIAKGLASFLQASLDNNDIGKDDPSEAQRLALQLEFLGLFSDPPPEEDAMADAEDLQYRQQLCQLLLEVVRSIVISPLVPGVMSPNGPFVPFLSASVTTMALLEQQMKEVQLSSIAYLAKQQLMEQTPETASSTDAESTNDGADSTLARRAARTYSGVTSLDAARKLVEDQWLQCHRLASEWCMGLHRALIASSGDESVSAASGSVKRKGGLLGNFDLVSTPYSEVNLRAMVVPKHVEQHLPLMTWGRGDLGTPRERAEQQEMMAAAEAAADDKAVEEPTSADNDVDGARVDDADDDGVDGPSTTKESTPTQVASDVASDAPDSEPLPSNHLLDFPDAVQASAVSPDVSGASVHSVVGLRRFYIRLLPPFASNSVCDQVYEPYFVADHDMWRLARLTSCDFPISLAVLLKRSDEVLATGAPMWAVPLISTAASHMMAQQESSTASSSSSGGASHPPKGADLDALLLASMRWRLGGSALMDVYHIVFSSPVLFEYNSFAVKTVTREVVVTPAAEAAPNDSKGNSNADASSPPPLPKAGLITTTDVKRYSLAPYGGGVQLLLPEAYCGRNKYTKVITIPEIDAEMKRLKEARKVAPSHRKYRFVRLISELRHRRVVMSGGDHPLQHPQVLAHLCYDLLPLDGPIQVETLWLSMPRQARLGAVLNTSFFKQHPHLFSLFETEIDPAKTWIQRASVPLPPQLLKSEDFTEEMIVLAFRHCARHAEKSGRWTRMGFALTRMPREMHKRALDLNMMLVGQAMLEQRRKDRQRQQQLSGRSDDKASDTEDADGDDLSRGKRSNKHDDDEEPTAASMVVGIKKDRNVVTLMKKHAEWFDVDDVQVMYRLTSNAKRNPPPPMPPITSAV